MPCVLTLKKGSPAPAIQDIMGLESPAQVCLPNNLHDSENYQLASLVFMHIFTEIASDDLCFVYLSP